MQVKKKDIKILREEAQSLKGTYEKIGEIFFIYTK